MTSSVCRIAIPFDREVDEESIRQFVAEGPRSSLQSVAPISMRLIDSRRVQVEVSPLSLEHLYYRIDASEFLISRDPRRLSQAGESIAPESIYSHLQFGMIVPPRSPWKSVRRFVPGFVYELNLDSKAVCESPPNRTLLFESRETNEEDMCQRFKSELDGVLTELCPDGDPVILFSGGVDSALLANRAVALGWSGTTLVNYSLGDSDSESHFAKQVADHLGLEFVRIMDDGTLDRAALSQLASEYPSPFGDYSALPTNRLSNAVKQQFSDRRIVLDGTGADASFGLFGKAAQCKRLYMMPNAVRRGLASMYSLDRVWAHPSRFEFFLRMCRRTQQMSPAPAAIARNPLHGVLYRFPNQSVRSVNDDIETWLDGLGIPSDLLYRLPMIDLVLGTANIFAQKNAPLFGSNQQIAYPFMDPRIALLAVSNQSWIAANRKPKAILKRVLASEIPDSMVYRTKHGFTVPGRVYFGKREYVELFEEAMASPLLHASDWAIQPNIRLLCDRLLRQEKMPVHIYHFVWYVVFLYLWLLRSSSAASASD